jgi:hypothetical protein
LPQFDACDWRIAKGRSSCMRRCVTVIVGSYMGGISYAPAYAKIS